MVLPSRSRPAAKALPLAGVLLLAAALSPLDAGAAEGSPRDAACMGCHGGMAGAQVKFADGSSLPALVEKGTWEGSVHAGRLTCTDCHSDITGYPHPANAVDSARSYQIDLSGSCKNCHYAYYTRVLDGLHFEHLSAGNQAAPTCVDCHGAHDIKAPGMPRTSIQERCATCHAETAATYATSVHGKALQDPAKADDVPVCTDCHGAHDIEDPGGTTWHANSYTICARCHGDEERMARYDLNPDVAVTYIDDFHGKSNQLFAMGAGEPDKPMATCTDCHGVHDIQAFDHAGEPEAVKARVSETCRQCHADAEPEFADAWLSHFKPSLATAPLVWAVQAMYWVLIPFILVGLVLHILLHLWRLRTHR